MMLKTISLITFLIISLTGNVHAELVGIKNDPALNIQSVTVTEVERNFPMLDAPTGPSNPIDEIAIVIDSLIALGKKIWPIINAGRPVITNKLIPPISVLPNLEGEHPALEQMENWSVPKAKSYRVSFKNVYNREVVGFTYTIYFQYNGDYGGIGKYVTNLKVQASEIFAAWGFNFDASSELVGISNVGSKSAPVASAVIQVSYIVKGLMNESRGAQSFYVDGAGNIQILNN